VLDGKFSPVTKGGAVFVEIAFPAVVMLEQQLCGALMFMVQSLRFGSGLDKGIVMSSFYS